VTATDVLVVGGGPSGSATATRLAAAGHRVTLVEKRAEPRLKACGDALTPRALRELDDLDVDVAGLGGHPIRGIRFEYEGNAVETPWPTAAGSGAAPSGMTLRRNVLDEALRRRAHAAGATVLMGYEATAPISERGFVRGATMTLPDGSTQDVRARFLVVADGANSRFGRGLGTTRQRHWPYVIATRTYFESPRSAEEWTEARLGPPDPNGHPISGFGWVHPLGDGTVNVGLGMLSSYRDVLGLNAVGLLRGFAAAVADDWQLDPAASLKNPARFRVPLGGSVGPKMGPTFLVTGDAGGLANPFNGEGIEPALVSARIAADVLDEALTTGNSTTLQQYPTALDAHLGSHHAVGRLSARLIGSPTILGATLRWGARSPKVMGGVLRIATNELRTEHPGAAEGGYALARLASRFVPGW